MRDGDIDRILSGEEPIAPSPDFVASVMVAVRRENGTPAPLSFPWKRAVPGIAAAIMTAVILCADVLRSFATPTVSGLTGVMFSGTPAVWTAIAALVSVAAVTLGTAISFHRNSN